MEAKATDARDAARIRVAIVDDHQLVLDGLAARLDDPASGISVALTTTSWAGLIGHPDFPVDVVVLDLHLEDGIPVGTKLRALDTIGTAVVVISRHSDAASVAAAMRGGAMGFVPKTESATELIAAIHAAAHSVQHVETPVADSATPAAPDAGLGPQEHRALALYASGRSISDVAELMNTTDETVKSYIKRGRRKYREVGVDVGTRILLRRLAVQEGWLLPD